VDPENKDQIEALRDELDKVQDKGDEERLETLERLHASLEREVEQADPAGH
jgi:hypothetical protein